jgi:3-methylcrotonyl-CoA carboxylase alpha subunit
MTVERRRAMGDAAIAAARAVGYVGAGTVEFIAEGDAFYFMEMNTRLQVEHPVTEMITGLDLVEWQLRIAAGESLPLGQDEVMIRGHAVEGRLYAENPARNFLPATGRLDLLRPPSQTMTFRIDSGVREGDSVSMHYDPMIAKVIAWGEDRTAALNRLAHGLAAYRIAGPATNRDFLVRLLRHSAFLAGEIETGFIERHRADLLPPRAPAPALALAAASLALLLADADAAAIAGAAAGDAHSPWHRRDGWRLNGDTYRDVRWRDGEAERSVRVHYRRDGYALEIDGTRMAAQAQQEPAGDLAIVLDGVRSRVAMARQGAEVTVVADDGTWRLHYIDPLAPRAAASVSGGRLTAPMPGKVTQVLIAAGGAVKRGQALMVLEAMKMEHTIAAPGDGTVERVHFAPGDLVEEGAELIAFSAAAE